MLICKSYLEIPDRRLHYRWNMNDFPIEHSHDFWEFMLIVRGEYKQSIAYQTEVYHPQDIVLIAPDDVHRVYPGMVGDCHLNIMVDTKFFQSACDFFGEDICDVFRSAKSRRIRLTDEDSKYIVNLTDRLSREENQKYEYSLKRMLLAFLIEKFFYVLIDDKRSVPKELRLIVSEMNKPTNIGWKVKDVLAMSQYGYTTLNKLFRKYYGCTLKDYLLELKLEHAKFAVLHSDISLLELTSQIGFASVSHFIRVFKEKYGESPAKFRRTNVKGVDVGGGGVK